MFKILKVLVLLSLASNAFANGMADLLARESLGDTVILTPRTEALLHRVAQSGQSMDTATDNDHVRVVRVGAYPDGCPAVGMVDFTQNTIRNFRVCSTQVYERHDNVSPTWTTDPSAQQVLMGVAHQALMYGQAQDSYASYQISAIRVQAGQARCGFVELTISSDLFLVGNDVEEVCP